MEAVATFCILLFIYFLGSMAIVQLVIHPFRTVEFDDYGKKTLVRTNHLKIILISMLVSLATTTIAYLTFA